MIYQRKSMLIFTVGLLAVFIWTATQVVLRAAGSATIAITAPITGTIFEEGSPIQISATVSGADSVQQIQLFADGGLLQSGAAAQLDYVWNGAAAGAHALTAVATVNGGSVISSSVASVLVRAAAHVDAPYPSSPVIIDWQWDSAGNVVRRGEGSDNWWPTWGDDDFLYSGYGDGSGFKPHTEDPLSLGFAKIQGVPSHFVGTNIRSVAEVPLDAEGAGGRKVEKNGGLLMVDGRLYMWVRNVDRDGNYCKLAWSDDRAVTWSYADWAFQEFGFCVFVNFGQNYADARDNYVYITSVDAPSGYQFVNDFIMMRVPKDQLGNRAAYEFFDTLDAQGQALWSTDINARGPIFSIADKARRGSIYYNKALGRYLFWQGYTGGLEQRTEGSFGIYDAPEPWGPWTTVYYTNNWDMGVGDAGGFPAKWMSADGRTVNMVFSGEDSFSVRQATLTVFEPLVPTPTPTAQPTPTPTLPASAQNVVLNILQTSDDVEERSSDGFVYVDSGTLDMAVNGDNTHTIGLRYQAVPVPQTGTVLRAYLEFTNRTPQELWTNLLVQGEAIDNAETFSEATNNVTLRPLTGAALDWSLVDSWPVKDAVYRSPDLAHVIQEITSRPGWQSGNSLSIIISGYGYRWARSYDVSPAVAPRLVLEYTSEILPTATPTAIGSTPVVTETSTPTTVPATPTALVATSTPAQGAATVTPTAGAIESPTAAPTSEASSTPLPTATPTATTTISTPVPTGTPVVGAETTDMFLPLINKP